MNFAHASRAPFVFTIHLTMFFLLCYAEEQGMVEVDMLISCWLTENQFNCKVICFHWEIVEGGRIRIIFPYFLIRLSHELKN